MNNVSMVQVTQLIRSTKLEDLYKSWNDTLNYLRVMFSKVDLGFYYITTVQLGRHYDSRSYGFKIHLYEHKSDNELKAMIRNHIIESGDEIALRRFDTKFRILSYERKEY